MPPTIRSIFLVDADRRVPVQHRVVAVRHVRDGGVSQTSSGSGAGQHRTAPDLGHRVPRVSGEDHVAQRERRVPQVREQDARLQDVFPGRGRQRFRRVRSVSVRLHHIADERVPRVLDPQGRWRQHRHRVLRAHVRPEPFHVFFGNPLRGAMFRAVPTVLPDQRGRVRAQVGDGRR